MTDAIIKRDAKGQWLPGQSGNPLGRKPRIQERQYLAWIRECTTEERFKKIWEKILTDAENGVFGAQKLVLNHTIGPITQAFAMMIKEQSTSLDSSATQERITQILAIAQPILDAMSTSNDVVDSDGE